MSKESKPKEYWEGVSDALSLVETFIYWREAHPEESKTLLEFIHEALREAKKHIGPSLLDLLGVSFTKPKQAENVLERTTSESQSKEIEELSTTEPVSTTDEISLTKSEDVSAFSESSFSNTTVSETVTESSSEETSSENSESDETPIF